MAASYEKRCADTLAERIIMALVENGTLTELEEIDLRWPSEDKLVEAEERME